MPFIEYKLPDIGEGIHEGEIVKWHVKPGDSVDEDQVIMEVQNDKAIVEIPSPVKGKVLDVKANEGAKVVVGDVLIIFDSEGANQAVDNKSPVVEKEKFATGTKAASPLATPSIRKLAREYGINLTEIKGTGNHGMITREDVLSFASGNSSTVSVIPDTAGNKSVANAPIAVNPENSINKHLVEEERIPLKGIRKVIADAMVKSMYTAPHVTIMDEVDVTELVELREKAKLTAVRKEVKLSYLPFILKAFIIACRHYPVMNASIDEQTDEIVIKKTVHAGIATDTENGLIVPVIKNADSKNIWMLAAEINDLAVRGRQGKLAPHELKGSTITISNMGSGGGLFFTPIIHYPEVAILGTGRIVQKPLVKNGQIIVAPVMGLSLSFDHRLIDGATAQNFLNLMKQFIEQPELMILEV